MVDEITAPTFFRTGLRTDVSLDSADALRRRGHNKGRAGIKREHRATISFRHGAQIPRDTRGGVGGVGSGGGGAGKVTLGYLQPEKPVSHYRGILMDDVHKSVVRLIILPHPSP